MNKEVARKRRHKRIRKKVFGTREKPRFCVFRSLCNITAQLVDDVEGKTLVGLSTLSKEVKGRIKRGNREGASLLGRLVAEKAKAKGISAVVFDRGGYRYHGRVKAVADAAREAGLKL